MANDLVDPSMLADFPGAPFGDGPVDAAVGAIRAVAGWHIAPERTETVVVDSRGGAVVYLPTRYLIAVTEVRDMTDTVPRVITDWRDSVRGKLQLGYPCGWPIGLGAIEVDIVHGYEICPPELLPIVAEYARAVSSTDPAKSQESLGKWSVSYHAPDGGDNDGSDSDVPAALARLCIPWGAT